MNTLQQIIFNVITEMENSTGDVFSGGNPSPNTFQNSDIRGDLAASNASNSMTKHKRSRKKIIASKILRRLPFPMNGKNAGKMF